MTNRRLQEQASSKYGQVMLDLVQRIERGEWKKGEPLPPVTQLAEQYHFNRQTVLKALGHLAREGYLSVEQGRGTFVQAPRARSFIGILFGADVFHTPSTRICSLLARAAQDYFHAHGQEVKLYVEHPHLFAQGLPNRDLFDDLENGRVLGLITAQSSAPAALAQLALWRKHRLPHVDLGVPGSAAHAVGMDRRAMTEIGLEFFQQRGRRRVGVIGFHQGTYAEQLAHLQSQAAARGLATRPEWVPPHAAYTEEIGYGHLREIWRGAEKPDALLITDDIMAKGVVQALLQLGVEVPRELLVICHANKGSGIFYPIPMPRLEFSPEEFVSRAGELLFQLMENPHLPPQIVFVRPALRLAEDADAAAIEEVISEQ